jgi:two-component system sensor histidine kinase BarA
MSYRSIKRVLGETSLERKCRILFGACLFILIAASFWWYGSQTEKIVYEGNRTTARLLVDQVMYIKHWEALETNKDFLEVVQDLTKRLSKQQYQWRFIKPNAGDSSGSPGDEFEWGVLDRFNRPHAQSAAAEDAFSDRLLHNNRQYDYYKPVYAEKSCLLCHSVLGNYAEGDLMAVVKVSLPNAPMQTKLNMNRAILIATAIVTVFLAMVASYAIVRYVIVKPLRHLRDVSDAISRGNLALRAEINTGDEFDELAVAFNRMLHHLATTQDGLRQANITLDGKVDELAQANMRLYELNMLKSDFLATMSHELRTPLNSILGFSDVLGAIESLSDKQKRYVQNIQQSGRTLLEMINDILDLAKIESGRMEPRPTEFRLPSVVSAQCDMARPLAERKNIDLECRLEADLPPLWQDQARVQQILNNLLSNAIKFTPEGGRITITARRDEADYLELKVIDTGVGIAAEDQATIFEKFRQGKTAVPSGDAMTREYSGSGLGLSIVKELCRLLGGEITLESEVGKGSTFTVRLPWTLPEHQRREPTLMPGQDELARFRFEAARAEVSAAGK